MCGVRSLLSTPIDVWDHRRFKGHFPGGNRGPRSTFTLPLILTRCRLHFNNLSQVFPHSDPKFAVWYSAWGFEHHGEFQ